MLYSATISLLAVSFLRLLPRNTQSNIDIMGRKPKARATLPKSKALISKIFWGNVKRRLSSRNGILPGRLVQVIILSINFPFGLDIGQLALNNSFVEGTLACSATKEAEFAGGSEEEILSRPPARAVLHWHGECILGSSVGSEWSNCRISKTTCSHISTEKNSTFSIKKVVVRLFCFCFLCKSRTGNVNVIEEFGVELDQNSGGTETNDNFLS